MHRKSRELGEIAIIQLPRRQMLESAVKDVSLKTLRDILTSGHTDAIGRSVLEAEIELREQQQGS